MSDRSDTWIPRHGRVLINTGEAFCSFGRLSTREIGAQLQSYLAGGPSVFEGFCIHKDVRPVDRPPWSEWKHTRQRIFERDGYRCSYCGATDKPLECDHVIPVARGGEHTDDNLTTSCQPCNGRKGSLTADEFRGKT